MSRKNRVIAITITNQSSRLLDTFTRYPGLKSCFPYAFWILSLVLFKLFLLVSPLVGDFNQKKKKMPGDSLAQLKGEEDIKKN